MTLHTRQGNHGPSELFRLQQEIERLRAKNAEMVTSLKALTVIDGGAAAEIERLEADKKALAYQVDHFVAELGRSEAEIKRLTLLVQSVTLAAGGYVSTA
jgi:hypothetical protein